MDYEALPIVGLAVEVVCHALLRLIGKDTQGALAEVKVYDDDLLALDCQGCGQVGGDEGLSGAYVKGGYHKHLAARILALHKFKVGADDAEGFVNDVSAVRLDYNLAVLRFVADADRGLEEAFLLICCGEFAKERRRQVFKVFSATYGRVKHFLEVEPRERYCEA